MIQNLGDRANINGFDKRPEDAKKGGRKPSLKKQLAKVALADGWIEFEPDEYEILDSGKVRIKVPTEEKLALQLFKIATGKNERAAIAAIKLYLETFDGKASQQIEIPENTHIVVNIPGFGS